MADSRDKKILRIGLIQNGKIVEERLLRRRESVTIGQSPRNTFVVTMVEGLPRSYNLFELKGDTYHLNFRAVRQFAHLPLPATSELPLLFRQLRGQARNRVRHRENVYSIRETRLHVERKNRPDNAR